MTDFLIRGSLEDLDPAVYELIQLEAERQYRKLILIPSESTAPLAVREAMGSAVQNIYAEGYPDEETRWMTEDEILDYEARLAYYRRYADPRYYKGVEYADAVESLARRRCAGGPRARTPHRNPRVWICPRALGDPVGGAGVPDGAANGRNIMELDIDLNILEAESVAEYHAKSDRFLSSHQLLDFVKCPWLHHKKAIGLLGDSDSPSYLIGRAAHVRILEGRAAYEAAFALGGPINPQTGKPYGATTQAFRAWADAQGKPVLSHDQVELVVEPESGRIDLNTAQDDLLVAYLRAAGWDAGDALGLVNRLRDWQDADDTEREGGLERDGYAALGAKGLPRNGPLESVEEIRQIPGAERLSPGLYEGLTVYSHMSEPTGKLPVAVKRALTFADEHRLGSRSWLRSDHSIDSERLVAGSVVRIRACSGRMKLERCREALVRLTGAITEPIQVFLWRDVTPSGSHE
jgi:hypothetical protein